MDSAALLGIVIAVGMVFVSLVMEKGNLASLLNWPALILILGGTLGMTMASFPMRRFARLPQIIAQAFRSRREDPQGLIDSLVQMAEKARKEGLLALQDDLAGMTNPLLARGLNMIVDGTDPDVVKESLTAQVQLEMNHTNAEASVLEQAGGYSPTVGIIGTVMGLVNVLANLEDTETLGPHIATAFLATFYGIFFANAFWLPLGNKIKVQAREHGELGRMIITGLVSLQTGENPRSMREKLEVFLAVDQQSRSGPPRGVEEL